MKIERLIGGQSPRGCGPDHHCAGALVQFADIHSERRRQCRPLVWQKRKGDVDCRIFSVGVFDLCFSKRRPAIEAPVHGFEPPVYKPRPEDASERADFVGFGFGRHRTIGVIPLAQHAQALEVLELTPDLLLGIGPGKCLDLGRRHPFAVLLFNLNFDRHAVAVPAWHISGIKTRHQPGLDNDVLQDLVNRMTNVNIPIRVGRTIVQHKQRPPSHKRSDPVVNAG